MWFYVLILFISFAAHANTLVKKNFLDQFSSSLGLVNISFAENQSTLTNEDATTTTAAQGNNSNIALNVNYNIPLNLNGSVFSQATVPVVTNDGSGLFTVGAGYNYFISSVSGRSKVIDPNVKLSLTPDIRYYIGGQLNLGYLIYVSETARKSDVLIELGIQAGIIYNFKKSLAIKAEAMMGRGIGVSTATTNTKFFAGISIDLDRYMLIF
ncbi:MAG: hypothetical protein H6622_04045 [Halobacteriovoraceae bacterium]|nr:hypothetical protein [Halobacteriovoraceae bacterium]